MKVAYQTMQVSNSESRVEADLQSETENGDLFTEQSRLGKEFVADDRRPGWSGDRLKVSGPGEEHSAAGRLTWE
jgi:hypothetical protein